MEDDGELLAYVALVHGFEAAHAIQDLLSGTPEDAEFGRRLGLASLSKDFVEEKLRIQAQERAITAGWGKIR